MKKHILVVGGSGTIGSAIVRALLNEDGCRVFVTSRRNRPNFPSGVEVVSADLLNPQQTSSAFASLPPITHLIYAGLYTSQKTETALDFRTMRRLLRSMGWAYRKLGWVPGLKKQIERSMATATYAITPNGENEAMLANTLSALEKPMHNLQHVGLVTGGKIYGMHLTPYIHPGWRTTMREDGPPAPGPNFYHFQEKRVQDGARRHGYTYTISRPPYVVGYAESVGFNLLKTLAVYATLLKEQQQPLQFPGDKAAADAIYAWCDVDQIGVLHRWALTAPTAQNQIFNISNGDPCSLRSVWADIAQTLEMPATFQPPKRPFKLLEDGAAQWPQIVEKHGLRAVAYPKLTQNGYLARICICDWDTRYDLSRLRQAGFDRKVDSRGMFKRWIQTMRDEKIIP